MELVTFWTNQPPSLRAPISVGCAPHLPVTQFDCFHRYNKCLLSAYDSFKSFAELWGYNGKRERNALFLPTSPGNQAEELVSDSCSPASCHILFHWNNLSTRGAQARAAVSDFLLLLCPPWMLSATLCLQCIFLKRPLAQRKSV